MAHLPLFKSSSFHLLVIQVQPRHRHKLKNLDLILFASFWHFPGKAEEQNAAKRCFPCASGDGCFETVGVANIHHKHSTVASSLTNALGKPSFAHHLGLRSDQKSAKRVDLSLKNLLPCKTGSFFIQFPQNGQGDQRVQAKLLTTSQVCLHPPIWHLHREKWQTKGLTAYPKVQMFPHANLFLTYLE